MLRKQQLKSLLGAVTTSNTTRLLEDLFYMYNYKSQLTGYVIIWGCDQEPKACGAQSLIGT